MRYAFLFGLVLTMAVLRTAAPRATAEPASGDTAAPSATAGPEQHYAWGDTDCDTYIQPNDVTNILKFALFTGTQGPSPTNTHTPGSCPKIGEPTQFGTTIGDVNCDGAINGLDALWDLSYLVSIYWQPPPPPTYCPPTGARIGY